MYSKLIETKNINNNIFWLAKTGKIGCSFLISNLDLEIINVDAVARSLTQSLKRLDERVMLRLVSCSEFLQTNVSENARSEDIVAIGSLQHRTILSYELERPGFSILKSLFKSDKNYFSGQIDKLLPHVDLSSLTAIGIEAKPLDRPELEKFFFQDGERFERKPFGVDLGEEVIGFLKLTKLSNHPVHAGSLAFLRENLPMPHEVHLTCQKMGKTYAQSLLNQKSKQEESGKGRVSFVKFHHNQEILEDVELHDADLFRFEEQIVFRRDSEETLRKLLGEAKRLLLSLGQFEIESFGAVPSYKATKLGSGFHFTLTEKDEVLPCYLPVFLRGGGNKQISCRSVLFHRCDHTIDGLDLFDNRYNNFCSIVIGSPGRGKSVFVNQLVQALAFDGAARIILVDVRGSHTKTVRKLGGIIHQVSPSKPSGINPLSMLSKNCSNETQEIALTFLEQLMLDEGEKHLGVEHHYALEEALRSFVKICTGKPTLDDFIKSVKALPRIEYLKRWQSDSLQGALFKENQKQESNRIHYYNFDEVMTASQKGIARAVMAAVMSDFSFQLLSKATSEKLIFIADETPFFIQECFQSFRLLNKNVRKLNASLTLVAQSSTDLVVGGDTSLLDNSDIKILFSLDGAEKAFKERLHLEDDELETVKGLKTVNRQYSQFLLKDPIGSRIGFLILSPREYLQTTTKADDTAQIEKVKACLPDLSEEQIIEFLCNVNKGR